MSLKQRTAIALAWDFGGNLAQTLSGFIISIFLARLLTPEEFGLVGMALVLITISQVFVDVGFASALIQNQETTHLSYSSVFWLNVIMGILLTLLFYFFAPYIGKFYENQEVTSLVRWLSLIFVFNAFSIVQTALLKKELNFRVLSISTIIGGLIGGVVGVVSAFLGFGVYSLVIHNIVTALLITVLLWSTAGWRPDFKFSISEIKKLIGYSSYVFFDRFVSSVFQRLDIVVIGKALSPATLGFYTRAVSLKNQVATFSSSSVSKVFFPVLASLQDNAEEFSKVYFKVISIVAFVSFGLTGILYVLGEDIIIVLFGEKWRPSVAIFQILILAACNYPLSVMMINAFMSKGRSRENFYIGLFRKSIRIIPLFIAYLYGIIPFAIGMVLASYFLTITNIMFLKKYTGLSLKLHFQKIFEGIVPLLVIILTFEFFDFEFILYRFILVFFFVLIYVIYNHVIQNEGYNFVRSNYPILVNKVKSKFLS